MSIYYARARTPRQFQERAIHGVPEIKAPATGKSITVNADNTLNVPNDPIIPFIEGDGIGVDVTPR